MNKLKTVKGGETSLSGGSRRQNPALLHIYIRFSVNADGKVAALVSIWPGKQIFLGFSLDEPHVQLRMLQSGISTVAPSAGDI